MTTRDAKSTATTNAKVNAENAEERNGKSEGRRLWGERDSGLAGESLCDVLA
jgi:hypothetical protein